MSAIEFTKMQASGNDFVIVRAADSKQTWNKLAPAMCHRRFGIGADGVLVLQPSKKANFKVRVFNSDGSEAEICGNGLISLGKYAVETGIVEPGNTEVRVETAAGIKPIEVKTRAGKVTKVKVSMGLPRFKPEDIPVLAGMDDPDTRDGSPIMDYPLFVGNRKLLLTFVSMGNPHAVSFTTKPLEDFPLNRLGPVIEHHPVFPKRVNFELGRVVDDGQIEAKVWERGAGETMACGTGACAIAVAARLHQYVGDFVEVVLPGGTLEVEWDGKGEVVLTGTAELVFKGQWQGSGG